jgi:dynein heavy chain
MRGTTSTFLELLESLKANLVQAQGTIAKKRTRYGRALDVAHHAQRAIATIGDGIAAARAALDATSFETVVFDTELSHKKSVSGVESKYAEVEADAEALLHEEAAARVLAEEFERDIAQAQPAFDEAYSSLETLGIDELSELRSLPRPPIGAKPILEAVCILLGEKPVKVADPVDPTRRVLDFWGAAQQRVLIGEPAQLAKRCCGP